jgi:3',5'-cyclic AMP phosphodiesterase CpdA
MRTIAHISDLHFGREDPLAAEGLVEDLARVRPTLVVNSGDFTQRARRRQFRAAAAYHRRLPTPQISVPGNHDVPLFDVIRRAVSPLERYKRYITQDLYPSYVDDELAVLGINTARSFTWKSGRISLEQIRRIERIFSALPSDAFKVLVTHHPFIPPPGDEHAGVDLVGRAALALDVIARCGIDLLLAGHVHHGYSGDVRTHYPRAGRSTIVVQAGTATSRRVRHEPNAYNHIVLDRETITICVRRWDGKRFSEWNRIHYRHDGAQWHRAQASIGA